MYSLLIVIILLIAIELYLICRFRRHEKEEKIVKTINTDNKLNANYSDNYKIIDYNELEISEQYADVALSPDYIEKKDKIDCK